MYVLKPGVKRDPERRWALPDRVFFGHGACHILAGVFLACRPMAGYYAERIVPGHGYAGNHIYVTDGNIAFDYHGYSVRRRLLKHYRKGWSRRYAEWDFVLKKVDFELLSTFELNRRKMLGPDQYLFDPIPRARRFIERIENRSTSRTALCSQSEIAK